MREIVNRLEEIAEGARDSLLAKNQAREAGLSRCREAIRHSANGIRAVHRGEFALAKELIDRAGALLREAKEALSAHPDIFHAGFMHDAQKEYAEARLTLAIIDPDQGSLPGPADLGVEIAAYLNGLGEVVGEMRRNMLDALRTGDIGHAEACLAVMDDIFAVLVTIDYPDAMTGGLRRTTDNARGILERSRGDLTVAVRQRDLEQTLTEFETRLRTNP